MVIVLIMAHQTYGGIWMERGIQKGEIMGGEMDGVVGWWIGVMG